MPGAVFADWGVGGAAFSTSPSLLGRPMDTNNMGVTALSFGGDVRLKLGWFQAEALLLYSGGEVNSFDAYLDAGIAFDVAAFRLSLGAGQSFTNSLGQGTPIHAGFNAKVGAEVMLGRFSVGVSYITAVGVNNAIDIPPVGPLGVNIILWM